MQVKPKDLEQEPCFKDFKAYLGRDVEEKDLEKWFVFLCGYLSAERKAKNKIAISSYSYFIAYDKGGKIIGKFAFLSSLLKFLSENPGQEITYKTFPL